MKQEDSAVTDITFRDIPREPREAALEEPRDLEQLLASKAPARGDPVLPEQPHTDAPADDEPEPEPVIAKTTALAKFDPVRKVLADLTKEISEVKYDINTTAGEDVARGLRLRCVKVRTTAKNLYAALNKPVLEVQKKWREQVAAIEAGVKPLEDPLDVAIKAKEDAREVERLRKIEEEKARIAALRVKIAAIAALPAAAVKQTTAELEQTILDLQAQVITEESFGEFVDEAILLRGETIAQLSSMLDSLKARDAEIARLNEQAAAQQAEELRLATERTLRARIDGIKAKAFDAMGKSAADIQHLLDSVVVAEPSALDFGDLQGEAAAAWSGAKTMIQHALTGQQAIEAQQAEQRRIQAEQDATAARNRQEAADLAARQKALDDEEAARKAAAEALVKAAEEAAKPTPTPTAALVDPTAGDGGFIGLLNAQEPDDDTPPPGMSMFASVADMQAATKPDKPGPWLRTDNVVYRVVDGQNFDQITVGVAGGSIDIIGRCNLARDILDLLLRAEKLAREEIPV
jgi:hypothetical protein